MTNAKRSSYWLIVPALILMVGLLAWAIAPTQSRVTMVTGWQMSISQADEALTSDLLTQEGQKIRLKDMSVADTRQIPLNLTTVGSVENMEMTVESQYLTVDVPLSGVYQETVTVLMTVSATEEAKQTITVPTEASAMLTLTWDGGALQGEILVNLTPAPEETLPEDGENGDGGSDVPADSGENDGNAAGDDESSTAGETTSDTGESTPNTNENTSTGVSTPNTDENTSTGESTPDTDENTNTGESTPDTDENTNTGESTSDTDENTNTGDSTPGTDESTDTEETTPDTDETVVPSGTWAQGMKNFAARGVLPLLMEVPDGCDRLQLTLTVGEGNAGEFPARTRYSIDGGASYTLLYDSGIIDFAPEQGKESVSLLIDFSNVTLDTESILTLTVSALQGESVTSTSSVLTQAGLTLPNVQLKTKAPMVTRDKSIQFIMPVYGDADSITVQRLPLSADQEENMPAVTLADGVLTISSDDGQAQAGTYRAVLTWSWNDLQIARQEVVFYVNYTPYVSVAEEPADTDGAQAAPAA